MNNPSTTTNQIKDLSSFDAYLSLTRFIALAKTSVPTQAQVDQALSILLVLFDNLSEEEILSCGVPEAIEVYNSFKSDIMRTLTGNQQE